MLVTPFQRPLYSAMVPGWVAGHHSAQQCTMPLLPLTQAARVPLLEASAVALDTNARTVQLSNGQQAEYDVLSIDTGSVTERDVIPGAREHGLFVRPLEHFVQLFDRVVALAQERVLDVVVVGSDAAALELAMALQYRLGAQARVALVLGNGALLPGYPARVVERATAQLKRWRITLLPGRCEEISAGQLRLSSGARVACDVPVLAIDGQAPAWLQGSGLALDERGLVNTTETLQSSSHTHVFAVGDVASRVDVQHPRRAGCARGTGPTLALNLRALLAGQPLATHRSPSRSLSLLACGDKHAIASWGDWSAQGRWVGWWKDHIDRAFVDKYVRQYSSNASAPPPTATTR
jgi:NADH dehydrogenase FAD-containing subunit